MQCYVEGKTPDGSKITKYQFVTCRFQNKNRLAIYIFASEEIRFHIFTGNLFNRLTLVLVEIYLLYKL